MLDIYKEGMDGNPAQEKLYRCISLTHVVRVCCTCSASQVALHRVPNPEPKVLWFHVIPSLKCTRSRI